MEALQRLKALLQEAATDVSWEEHPAPAKDMKRARSMGSLPFEWGGEFSLHEHSILNSASPANPHVRADLAVAKTIADCPFINLDDPTPRADDLDFGELGVVSRMDLITPHSVEEEEEGEGEDNAQGDSRRPDKRVPPKQPVDADADAKRRDERRKRLDDLMREVDAEVAQARAARQQQKQPRQQQTQQQCQQKTQQEEQEQHGGRLRTKSDVGWSERGTGRDDERVRRKSVSFNMQDEEVRVVCGAPEVVLSPSAASKADEDVAQSAQAGPNLDERRAAHTEFKQQFEKSGRRASVSSSAHSQRQSLGKLGDVQEAIPSQASLEPLHKPELALNSIINAMRSDNWEKQLEGVTRLRRLICHHQAQVDNFKDFVPPLVGAVDNLRSYLARSAIRAISELFEHLGTHPEVSKAQRLLVPMLLKKFAESNAFLREEADQALSTMVECCLPTKSLEAFLGVAADKAPVVRAQVSIHLALLAHVHAAELREGRSLARLVAVVQGYLKEGKLETRLAAKETAKTLKERLPPAQQRMLKDL